MDKIGDPDYRCQNCYAWRTYWNPEPQFVRKNCKESQTETNPTKDQESQTELQEAKSVIEKQKMEIEKLNSKVSILEDKLQHYVTENENLTSQLEQVTLQKEEAVKHANELSLRIHTRDEELSSVKLNAEKLQAEVQQYHLQLEQYRHQLNAQSSKVLQQPCSPQVTSNILNYSELNNLKATLQDLQVQQQKISMIVSHLYYNNRRQALDTTNTFKDYPSFNPYMGPLDTGQYFNKLQMV